MPISDITPTLTQVGALVRTRTKDDAGNEIGTFNDKTRPTNTEVNELMQQAVDTVATRSGTDVPAELIPEVQRLAALRAAMLVEISYYPEQVAAGQSPYAQYHEMWVEMFGDAKTEGTVIQAIESYSGSGELPADREGLPNYSFPKSPRIGSRRL